ncbi:MAG: cation:proton antiporter [Cytophagales bacterium]|nr:cation:proton antiporter [Bernardetiaceae bacterium]MDW8204375.1 cation:proton antiporter [Cytophagales bacterium]
MKRNIAFYSVVVVILTAFLWWLFHQGRSLENTKNIVKPAVDTHSVEVSLSDELLQLFAENLHHPVALLLVQVIIIVFFARMMGVVATRVGQPSVVGEIIAGIVLGPSVVGGIFPELSALLFPPESLKSLQALSQFGLVLFMFIIGMELDISILKRQAQSAIVVSHASILFPYVLGVGLSYFLYVEFAPNQISFTAFGLFMGIAMSITAFPVLARIVQERGLSKTPLGSMVITCAAADDVTAWCILAAVIAIVKAGTAVSALLTILASTVYVAVMLYVVRPFLVKFAEVYASKENINRTVIAFIFLLLLLSAFITELIGIHALFGAFLAGAIIPHNLHFKEILAEKIEDVSLVLLLPIFFVFTGLRTEIGLLSGGNLWIVCLVVILTAIAGKFLGSAIPARIVGQTWHDSFVIGALMNTRGLMELVVLNIGYELGILSPEIFAMMVLMAVVTTMMTGPALNLIEKISEWLHPARTRAVAPDNHHYHILISFGVPAMGRKLLQLAAQMSSPPYNNFKITALHITPNSQVSPIDAQIFEQEGFAPVKELASQLQIAVECIYKTSDDLVQEVEQTVEEGQFDFLLIGSARSLFSTDRMGGVVQRFLFEIDTEIGILIDKGLNKIRKLLLLLDAPGDMALLPYVKRFAEGGAQHLTVIQTNSYLSDEKNLISKNFSENFSVDVLDVSSAMVDWSLKSYDLLLVSRKTYEKVTELSPEWESKCPSTLVIRSVN